MHRRRKTRVVVRQARTPNSPKLTLHGMPIPTDLEGDVAEIVSRVASAVREARKLGGSPEEANLDHVFAMLRENPKLSSYLTAADRFRNERERAIADAMRDTGVSGALPALRTSDAIGGGWAGGYEDFGPGTLQTWASPTGRVTGMGSRWSGAGVGSRKDEADAVPSQGWLRKWAETDVWVRAAINARRTQVSRTFIACVPRNELRPYSKVLMKKINQLLLHPNEARQNWSELIGMSVEDLMVLDRGCISKNLNARGEPLALYAEDGATIRVYVGWSGNPKEPRYLYVSDDGKTRIPLLNDQLICMIDNPATSRVGLSPVQVLSDTIQADLKSQNTRMRQLAQKPPPIIIQLPGAQTNQLNGVRDYYDANIAGNKEALFLAGEQPMVTEKMIYSSRENQLMEYQTYLCRQIAVTFRMPLTDFGAEAHATPGDVVINQDLFIDRGLVPLLMLIEEYFNQEILGAYAPVAADDPFHRPDLEALNLCIKFPIVGEEQRQLHADKAAQIAAKSLIQLPSMTLNQILSMRGETLVDGGNTFYVNTSMGPVPWLSYDGNDPSLNPLMAMAGMGDIESSSGTQDPNLRRGAKVTPPRPGGAQGSDSSSGTGSDNPPPKPTGAAKPGTGGKKPAKTTPVNSTSTPTRKPTNQRPKAFDPEQYEDDRRRLLDGRQPGFSWNPATPAYQRLVWRLENDEETEDDGTDDE